MKIAAIIGSASVLLGVSAIGAQAAELVLNGGFEDGVYTDAGGNNLVPVDWTPASSFDYGGGDFNGVASGNAHSGTYAVTFGNYDAQPASSISQAFNDVAGATYSASFWIRPDSTSDSVASFTAQIDGSDVVNVGDAGLTTYTDETFSFTGTGRDTLTLNASTNPGEWHLDDVSVMGPAAGTVSAAPEPASWSLMIAGVGMIGLSFRRARRRHGFTFARAV